MTGAPRGALYTPDMLGLAVSLAQFPLTEDLPHMGEARSATCGSAVALGCALDEHGAISRLGLRASACAVGQAAAALFAQSAKGHNAASIARARRELASWLAGQAELPDWPGIATIAPARGYPGRHGAVTLAWDAALAALSKAPAPG